MARRRPLALLAATAVLAVAACGVQGEDRPNRAATLLLDGRPSAVHAGIELALARDYDEAEGVRLRVRPASSPGRAVRLLATGRAQLAILDIHDLALARQHGRHLVGVMALVQRPLTAVLAAAGVRRPRALAGARVGLSGRAADHAVLDAVVRGDGGDPRRLRRVAVGRHAVSALLEGRVAAATGSWATEGVRLLKRMPGAHAFRADDFGVPGYPELVLCVARPTLEQERDVVRATLAALRRGYQEALVDPESAVGALVDRNPGLDRAAAQLDFDTISPAFMEGVTRFGDLDRARLRTWARWEARVGITRRAPNVGRAFAFGF